MADSFREAELRGWTARADGYDRHFRAISDQLAEPVFRALGSVSGRRVLDVCCGPGHLAAALAEAGADALGVDFAPTMIDLARRRHPRVAFVVGDAEALAHPDEAFDHVVCLYGIMHLADPDLAMAEALRVLRPGGRYVFSQWADDDELFAIVGGAVAAHGARADGPPDAPPAMRFGNPGECLATLSRRGFAKPRVERVDVRWTGRRPEDVLTLIREAATRVAMLLEAQPPARRSAIEAAITAAARERLDGPGVTLRRPTLLAIGEKPVP